MHRLIATLAAALMVLAFAAPVSAVGPGTLLIKGTPGAVVDRDGSLTLRLTYNCVQYDAPYNGWDILGVVIFQFGSPEGHYATTTYNFVTCDGTDHRITLILSAFDGGLSGAATLSIGHQGQVTDGTSGLVAGDGNFEGTIKVVNHQ